jgi:hypothetical protein
VRQRITSDSRDSSIEFSPGEWWPEQVRCIEEDVAIKHHYVSRNLIASVHKLGTGVSPATLLPNPLDAEVAVRAEVRAAPSVVTRI